MFAAETVCPGVPEAEWLAELGYDSAP
jgi:hypothetical protein